jgi:imidazolonepropionase
LFVFLRGLSAEVATAQIINEQIPELKRLMEAKELSVENIDVFCEKGVFDTVQSKNILQAGKNIGLKINFHGDELHPTNSAEVIKISNEEQIMYIGSE